MNYASDIEKPSEQIKSIILTAVPTANYQGTLQSLTPFEEQREQVVNQLTTFHTMETNQAVQTKDQTDLVNQTKRYLRTAEGKNTQIRTEIEKERKDLDSLKKDLQREMSKQRIAFDLFIVFGITLSVYLFFRSFSFVHGLAAFVLVAGIVYILNYNAYRLRFFGFGASDTVRDGSTSDNAWWKEHIFSSFK
jgi:hypothetical protein